MVALESDVPVVATNENCVPFISGFCIAVAGALVTASPTEQLMHDCRQMTQHWGELLSIDSR